MTLDHPHIRALLYCQACDNPKEPQHLLCWRCYRRHDMRYGNAAVEACLDEIEANLDRKTA